MDEVRQEELVSSAERASGLVISFKKPAHPPTGHTPGHLTIQAQGNSVFIVS